MDEVLNFLKGFNIQTIISMFFMLWYFSHHIESKIEKQSARTDRLYEIFCEESKKQAERTDKLYEMFIDLLKEKK